MQVEIKIDDNCIEPKVIIVTEKVTDEINDILNALSSKTPEVITGFYNDLAEILSAARLLLLPTRKNISLDKDYTSLRNSLPSTALCAYQIRKSSILKRYATLI